MIRTFDVAAVALLLAGAGCAEGPARGGHPVDEELARGRSPCLATAVLTQHNDNRRSGANLCEVTLAPAKVAGGRFGKRAELGVDGDLFAQPLFVPGVEVPGRGPRDVVYLATEHDSVYAFDAAAASGAAPLWQVSLGRSVKLPHPEVAASVEACRERREPPVRESGITGTPVIDPGSRTLYVVAFAEEGGPPLRGPGCIDPASCERQAECARHRFSTTLHALDLATGAERPGSPVKIEGEVFGHGAGARRGVVHFDPTLAWQDTALLLSQGKVYVGFGSYGVGDRHGWLFAYDAATLRRTAVWSSTPEGAGGELWQSGQGPAADEEGTVYVAVASGDFDAAEGGTSYGDSLVRFTPALRVTDYFASHLHQDRALCPPPAFDCTPAMKPGLGAVGPLLVPATHLVVGGAATGVLALVNRDDMGRFTAGSDRIVASFTATWPATWDTEVPHEPSETYEPSALAGAPVFWKSGDGAFLYVWGAGDYLKGYRFESLLPRSASVLVRSHRPSSVLPAFGLPITQSQGIAPVATAGGALSLSASGGRAGSGIVWAVVPERAGAPGGSLRAFDASDLSKELWSSKAADGDDLGAIAPLTPPTVIAGKVFVATRSGKLVVYGLGQ